MNTKLCIKINKVLLFLTKVCYRLHLNFLGQIISFPRIKITLKLLKNKISNSLSKEYNFSNLKKLENNDQNIFLMWFQGEKEMPAIIRKCYESIKKNFPTRKIILITESNFNDYISLDNMIIEKYKKGTITRTTLSDIIRAKLLYEFGGMWIDATIFLSKPFDEDYFQSELYGPCGIKSEMNKDWKLIFDKTNGWNGWCMGSCFVNYPFFDFLYSSFVEYYKKEDYILDYFQIDFITRIFYDTNSHFRNHIQHREANNIYSHDLARKMNLTATKVNIENINKLLELEPIHKLTYKRKWDLSKKSNKISGYFYNEI